MGEFAPARPALEQVEATFAGAGPDTPGGVTVTLMVLADSA